MNRYLFKAKRKDNGEWVCGYYIRHLPYTPAPLVIDVEKANKELEKDYNHYIMFDGFSDWNMPRNIEYKEIISETLCQCTGLENFYEHDLVKYEDENEIYEIVWFDEDCYFGLKGNGLRDSEMLYYKDIFKYLKLLGNKFDKEED